MQPPTSKSAFIANYLPKLPVKEKIFKIDHSLANISK